MSLLRLVSYGAQDRYLSENPQLDFFNVVYKRAKEIFLREEFIENIPKDCCPICLEDFMQNDNIHKTMCGHYYHHRCIFSFINIMPKNIDYYNCPMCRCQLKINYK